MHLVHCTANRTAVGLTRLDPAIHAAHDGAMPRTLQQWIFGIGSFAVGFAPMTFGVFRAWNSGDNRMFWMALMATVMAQIIAMIARANFGVPRIVPQALVTLVFATLAAGGWAYLLGATGAPGTWSVAFVFGLCLAARPLLEARSRPAPEA